jgi:hypothetical protein
MSESLERYLQHRRRLAHVRWVHAGFESPEEDALLDEMDETWHALDAADRAELRQRPPAAQLTRPVARRVPGQRARVDIDVFARADMPPRLLAEVA